VQEDAKGRAVEEGLERRLGLGEGSAGVGELSADDAAGAPDKTESQQGCERCRGEEGDDDDADGGADAAIIVRDPVPSRQPPRPFGTLGRP